MASPSEILDEDAARICRNIDLSELANKHILLTGASGLLGLHFLTCLRHLKLNLNVPLTVTAVVHSSIQPEFAQLTEPDFIEVVRGDIADPDFQKSLPSSDIVIHAAGYGQPGLFTSDPIRTLELNSSGTLGLLRRLKPEGKFLFTSSAEVYTGLVNPPFSETQIGTTNTNHPRSCYIEGKRVGEAFCQAFRSQGVNAKSARISLTYGPGTKAGDTRVLNTFIEKGFRGEISLLDAGQALRSFLYVSDAIEMMWEILLRGREPIYNVGGFSTISILELAEQIGKILGANVQKSNESGMAGAPRLVQLDMSRYESEFGRRPRVSLEQGLLRTIAWQRQFYQPS